AFLTDLPVVTPLAQPLAPGERGRVQLVQDQVIETWRRKRRPARPPIDDQTHGVGSGEFRKEAYMGCNFAIDAASAGATVRSDRPGAKPSDRRRGRRVHRSRCSGIVVPMLPELRPHLCLVAALA